MPIKRLSGINLLYVEDEAQVRDTIVKVLSKIFDTIHVATNGQEGLKIFKEESIDLVLTDIIMPKMDGLDMSAKIKKINPDTPIIAMSAFNDSQNMLKAIRIGITNYLEKPISMHELYEVLEKTTNSILLKHELESSTQLLNQYKEIVDETTIVSKSDLKGNITFVNKAFEKISGYSSDELIGKPHNILRHPDMHSSVYEKMWSTIKNRQKWQGIIKNRAKDGSTYIVESLVVPILDKNDQIVEYISLRNDITAQEEYKELIEKNLKSSKENLHEQLQFINEYEKALNTSTLYCRTTLNGIITTASILLAKRLGCKNHRNLLNNEYESFLIDKKRYSNVILDDLKEGKMFKDMLLHKTLQGETLYFDTSMIPIFNSRYEIEEILCFFADMTESELLNQEIITTQREVIITMGAIGETRSRETGEHVKRVAEYSKLLALKYGLSEEESENLKMASPMHDIGKVGIADSILHKPGKLTHDEFEIMKTHAQLGYEMLKNSKQPLLQSAAIVAHEHHEKYNGKGYPRGLSGDDIHIYGRITAIADVFDALGHDRVYKKAWPLEDIYELLRRERGEHFDPQLIDIFFENLDEILKIKNFFDKQI